MSPSSTPRSPSVPRAATTALRSPTAARAARTTTPPRRASSPHLRRSGCAVARSPPTNRPAARSSSTSAGAPRAGTQLRSPLGGSLRCEPARAPPNAVPSQRYRHPSGRCPTLTQSTQNVSTEPGGAVQGDPRRAPVSAQRAGDPGTVRTSGASAGRAGRARATRRSVDRAAARCGAIGSGGASESGQGEPAAVQHRRWQERQL